MIFRVTVGAPGGDEVNYPAERPSRPDPGYACHDQPDNADQYPTVINLSNSGNKKAQNACYKWITHCYQNLREMLYADACRFVHSSSQLSVVRCPLFRYSYLNLTDTRCARQT